MNRVLKEKLALLGTGYLIMWEKVQISGVDHYNIYREVYTNSYMKIAEVPYADMSEYIDSSICKLYYFLFARVRKQASGRAYTHAYTPTRIHAFVRTHTCVWDKN